MSAHAVDDGITHSNEPDCCEGKHYEPTTCDDHPLADLRKLTKWHEDQHPELGYLWGVERENRNLTADVKRLEAERDGLQRTLDEWKEWAQ